VRANDATLSTTDQQQPRQQQRYVAYDPFLENHSSIIQGFNIRALFPPFILPVLPSSSLRASSSPTRISRADERKRCTSLHDTGASQLHPDHELRGSANPVLTATGHVSGKGQMFTPTESIHLNRSKNVTGD